MTLKHVLKGRLDLKSGKSECGYVKSCLKCEKIFSIWNSRCLEIPDISVHTAGRVQNIRKTVLFDARKRAKTIFWVMLGKCLHIQYFFGWTSPNSVSGYVEFKGRFWSLPYYLHAFILDSFCFKFSREIETMQRAYRSEELTQDQPNTWLCVEHSM